LNIKKHSKRFPGAPRSSTMCGSFFRFFFCLSCISSLENIKLFFRVVSERGRWSQLECARVAGVFAGRFAVARALFTVAVVYKTGAMFSSCYSSASIYCSACVARDVRSQSSFFLSFRACSLIALVPLVFLIEDWTTLPRASFPGPGVIEWRTRFGCPSCLHGCLVHYVRPWQWNT